MSQNGSISGTFQDPSPVGGGLYPFTDTATLKSSSGYVLPSSLFTDARVYAPGTDASTYLKKLSRSAAEVQTVYAEVWTASGKLASGYANSDGASLALRDAYSRVVGALLGPLDALPICDLSFTPGATLFTSTVLVPQPAATGLEGFLVDGQLFSGDVVFYAEMGVKLTNDDNGVGVHIVGDSYRQRLLCQEAAQAGDDSGDAASSLSDWRPIKTLKVTSYGHQYVLTPDDFGNIFFAASGDIAPDNPLRVLQGTNRLTISLATT